MRSIINLFSEVVPNFTKQSYKDLEAVNSIMGKEMFKILSTVDLITEPVSNPIAIAYNSAANTLLVTLLHLTLDQSQNDEMDKCISLDSLTPLIVLNHSFESSTQ
jgi:hypothetical protein